MNEARMEHCHDCDSCEKVTLETAREYLCPDCQDINNSNYAIAMLENEIKSLKEELKECREGIDPADLEEDHYEKKERERRIFGRQNDAWVERRSG